MKALPINEKDQEGLPRQYIANVIYTTVGKPFYDWVEQKIQERDQEIVKDQNMGINLDPEIAAIFKASTSVSGKSIVHFN